MAIRDLSIQVSSVNPEDEGTKIDLENIKVSLDELNLILNIVRKKINELEDRLVSGGH